MREVCEWLTTASQYNESSVQLLEKNVKGFLSEGFMKEVAGGHPLVGAAFQLLAFGLPCTANIIALKVDEKRRRRVREEMGYVAGLIVTEMVHAVKRGSGSHAHLKALSQRMDGLESTVRMLDAHVYHTFCKNFFLFIENYCQRRWKL